MDLADTIKSTQAILELMIYGYLAREFVRAFSETEKEEIGMKVLGSLVFSVPINIALTVVMKEWDVSALSGHVGLEMTKTVVGFGLSACLGVVLVLFRWTRSPKLVGGVINWIEGMRFQNGTLARYMQAAPNTVVYRVLMKNGAQFYGHVVQIDHPAYSGEKFLRLRATGFKVAHSHEFDVLSVREVVLPLSEVFAIQEDPPAEEKPTEEKAERRV